MRRICHFILTFSMLQATLASASLDDGIERLDRAVWDKNVPLVESILKEGVNPNGFYKDRFPLLSVAHGGSPKATVKIIDLLIDAGADPNLQTVWGTTALMAVADQIYASDPIVAEELIKKGAKLDLKNYEGNTALMLSIFRDPAVVELLTRAGASLNVQNKNGYTPLMIAIYATASSSDFSKAFDIILRAQPDLEVEQNTPPPYSDDGVRTALDVAVHLNLPEITRKLLKAGAKIEGPNRSALIAGARSSYKGLESIKLLISSGAKINLRHTDGYTALMSSVVHGKRLEVLEYLASVGADLDLQNTDGDTALILAARRWVWEAIPPLLNYKANPNIQGRDGESVIMLAYDFELIKQIIKAGANLDLQDINGETVLMKHLQQPNVDLYIKAGANVNIRNKDGKTALGLTNSYPVRQALIKAGGIE